MAFASVTFMSIGSRPVGRRRSSRKRRTARCNKGLGGPEIPIENDGSMSSLPAPSFTLKGIGMSFRFAGCMGACANDGSNVRVSIRKFRIHFIRFLPTSGFFHRKHPDSAYQERNRTLLCTPEACPIAKPSVGLALSRQKQPYEPIKSMLLSAFLLTLPPCQNILNLVTTLALTEMLGMPVFDTTGARCGRVHEMALQPQEDRNYVSVMIVRTKSGDRIVPF